MRKERKHFTPEEKVAILRRHVVDKVPVSELCEELGLRPTMFYRWQKELFENGAALFSLMLTGHQQEIQAERDRKLDAAKEQRKNRRQGGGVMDETDCSR